MNNQLVYQMDDIENLSSDEKFTLIYAPNEDERSISSFSKLITKINVDQILEIRYSRCGFPKDITKEYSDIVQKLEITNNKSLLPNLIDIDKTIWNNEILIDISGLKTPDLFTLLKFLKLSQKIRKVIAVYTMPYDYVFNKEPFTSYKSYEGELEICEPIGFSGNSSNGENSNLIIFLGFEGPLSKKITDDYTYNNLILVNCLPSLFSKYKDISVLNNYDTIPADQKMYYTPADNPFETFNFLDEIINPDESVCISPLSTKPVALGVCLYALNNGNVRILYPESNVYKMRSTIESYKSYFYEIPLEI